MRRGQSDPRTGLTVIGLIAVCVLALHFPLIYPPGLPDGGEEWVEGVIGVPDVGSPEKGWPFANFQPMSQLARNERLLSLGGSQPFQITCLLPGPRPAALDTALTKAAPGRVIRVRMLVEPRFTAGECARWHATRPGVVVWGDYMRILRVTRAEPLACRQDDYLQRPFTYARKTFVPAE